MGLEGMKQISLGNKGSAAAAVAAGGVGSKSMRAVSPDGRDGEEAAAAAAAEPTIRQKLGGCWGEIRALNHRMLRSEAAGKPSCVACLHSAACNEVFSTCYTWSILNCCRASEAIQDCHPPPPLASQLLSLQPRMPCALHGCGLNSPPLRTSLVSLT